ncbi:MAG: hypothetical protein ACRD2B_09160 [Terriglobia bacterium]
MGVRKQAFHEVCSHPRKWEDDCAIALFVALGLLCTSLGSSACPAKSPPVNIPRLIRNVAYNELHARSDSAHLYQYVQRQESPQLSQTTLEIRTRRGTVGRLIRVNGKPPSASQCAKSLHRLSRIAASRKLQRSRFRSQQADMTRRESLFAVMPEAFIYHFEGIEKDSGWIRLKYEPNPQFHPTSRTEGVLEGLAGTLWVDPVSQRLVRINGTLVKTVTFGWGILARLNPGGHFEMEQARVSDGSWQQTLLAVTFQGRILLVKKLEVNLRYTFRSFKRIADDLTVSEAATQLQQHHVQCEAQ